MWPEVRTPSSWLLTVLLVAVAALAARLAITEPGTPWFHPALRLIAYVAATIMVGALDARAGWFTRRSPRGHSLSPLGILVGALLVGTPFAMSAARILATTYFRPLEQVSITALTHFAFFALAVARVPRSTAAAAAVSFVLLLAALMLGEHPAIVPLAAAYGGLGVAWLAIRHWHGVASAARNGVMTRLPMVPVLGAALTLAGVTAASTRLAQGLPDIWGEWLPSSGGSRWAHPAALLGIGDGEWVISGPRARSTGAIDSDYFLESDLSTIYDVLTEAYGEPRKPHELQRAIFVDPEQMLSQPGHKAPDSGAEGRRFSVYRRGRAGDRTPPCRADGALLYVEGRLPVHLALCVYVHFDGVRWCELPEQPIACPAETRAPDFSWLWLPHRHAAELLCGTRHHRLRLGLLMSERLPLPSHPLRVRFGRHGGDSLERWAREVLAWVHDGLLRARPRLPSGTYLEVESRAVDRQRLARPDSLRLTTAAADDPCLDVPIHLRPSAAALAHTFAHLPRGWEQVNALLEHLRTHYAHDRDAIIPPTCSDPIHHFLHHSRGGPAYQFATAAALALRSLGYPTRVVSGFYAGPDKYDARAGLTPVRAADAHFWIEVRAADGTWVTLDPTPGYRIAWYEPSWYEHLAVAAAALREVLRENLLLSLVGGVLSVVLWCRRGWVRERLLTLWCLWWPLRGAEQRLADTLRLLDLRSRLSGRPRPAGTTPLAWYQAVDDPACRTYLGLLYDALYGDAGSNRAASSAALLDACRGAVRATAVARLRAVLACSSPVTAHPGRRRAAALDGVPATRGSI